MFVCLSDIETCMLSFLTVTILPFSAHYWVAHNNIRICCILFCILDGQLLFIIFLFASKSVDCQKGGKKTPATQQALEDFNLCPLLIMIVA